MTPVPETCPRCDGALDINVPGQPVRDLHWSTREGHSVCPDLVRPDALGEPEWDIAKVMREHGQLRADVRALLDHIDSGTASLLGDVVDRTLLARIDDLRESSSRRPITA